MSGFTFDEQLQHVIQSATFAPSVHNSQPWRFVAFHWGLELRADRSRQLAYLDPSGRQLHLSCGAALLHVRVAARALGLAVDVTLLPDPSDPTLLARVRLQRGMGPSFAELGLATAILHRHTHRGAFDSEPLSPELAEQLRRLAEGEGAVLVHLTREDQLVELQVLLDRADAAEISDERYRAELAEWVQRDAEAGEGIPEAARATAPGSDLRQRDFSLTLPAQPGPDDPPAKDHAEVFVIATVDDGPRAWLQAGQALAAVLLQAADHDVQAQPLGQVTDLPAYRARLAAALDLVTVPQLVLRMGHAPALRLTTRRPVERVVRVLAAR